ncbi:unnamed protein product [Clonostachys solani]|uniref:Uncharacterized protein n=1 Tax=Clonostachys solani TaxID=160281 RepID=A0A9N9W6B7_9HYPO|nr:unnamed protein product [Clonostachys solani]
MAQDSPSVAVVGLGVLGLVAVKNLAEEGFNVVGFERSPFVGGLWHFSEEDRTSVLPTTVINISKERGCYTDFPFPQDAPSHCTARDVQDYLESYVEHFGLSSRLRLGTNIQKVIRDEEADRWKLLVEGSDPLFFDKVVIATGAQQEPQIPDLPNIDKFSGNSVHSRSFKKPEDFKGKKVLVVGLGSTGVDTATTLVGEADKVYLSYRHGAVILPRKVAGVPFDHSMTLRKINILGFLETNFPSVFEFMTDKGLGKMSSSAFKFDPEWRIVPAPSIRNALPVISDNIVDLFRNGKVQPISHGVKQVVGSNEVEMDDGTKVDVDTIIWCTGYKHTFKILDAAVDPTRNTSPEWEAAMGSRGKPLPRLYRNVFSLEHPQSLAFLGCVAFATGAFPLYDLATMSIAQIWKGSSALPSTEEMNLAVDAQHKITIQIAKTGSAHPGWVNQKEWLTWANDVAGTGLNERLGWGWAGWKFWFQNRRLYSMLVDGIFTPHILRLFDGKRKKWDGANEEIERVNRSVQDMKKRRD